MRNLLFALMLLFLTSNYASPNDLKECTYFLKESGVENLAIKWCFSKKRSECLPYHGAEWCDTAFALEQESEILDKQINKYYKIIMKEVSESQRESIRNSQRAWLKFRDLDCNAQLEMVNGGDPLMRSNVLESCKINYTKLRIKQFKDDFCEYITCK